MHDRRNNPRMLCADLVRIQWKDKSGKVRKSVANLEDISANGACIQVDTDVLPNTVINITHPKGELIGIVRYCEYREIGYYLGVEFQEGKKWSMRHFRPQHLLDPRRLVQRKDDAKPPKNGALSVRATTCFVF